ncbi:serine/threonine-protein kinase [Bradyrhizobium sp. AS23.2]|uniref:serine/threonine protein kinase n=1 Tax=Bradyrhizobium sp. AS23.2 TaxID=1680155 RepID=UPI00093E5C3E|nr:serine/threonine-protein kinase [Bradyrhizobium sp. AS23.2]
MPISSAHFHFQQVLQLFELVKPLNRDHSLLEYVVQDVLGQGGFGTTYLCRDEHLQKLVVIKEYTPHRLVRRGPAGNLEALGSREAIVFADGLGKFLEEARKLALFHHPNIVRVNRYFQAHGTGYFVMDYEAGGSLREIISNLDGAMPDQEVEGLILPLCDGLAQLHRLGLLHRDIKPDNVVVRPDGSPALIDFGAAVQFGDAARGPIPFIGTEAYAPPEQFDPTGDLGPWTDIYSLGAVMFEMVTGRRPSPARRRLTDENFVSVKDFVGGKYSDRLLSLIDKCLSLDRRERPQNINECLVLLRADRDQRFRLMATDISLKMAAHFCNWANPNGGLNVDELIAFMIAFPATDLSWRIGKGLPSKETAERLLNTSSLQAAEYCAGVFADRGFQRSNRPISSSFVLGRMDEYAATYLLDRRKEEWRYELTLQHLAENCISASHQTDVPGFIDLMEQVTDRARGRVKKEFRKLYRKVTYRRVESGWVKEFVNLEEDDH